MGLFDSLKNITKGDLDNLTKKIADNIEGVANDIVGGVASDIKKVTDNYSSKEAAAPYQENKKEIPAIYSDFPKFSKNPDDFITKETDKYTRCSMTYNNVTNEEIQSYIMRVQSQGYYKGSKVRYDKSNTYIIIDNNPPSGALNIVFHIKK